MKEKDRPVLQIMPESFEGYDGADQLDHAYLRLAGQPRVDHDLWLDFVELRRCNASSIERDRPYRRRSALLPSWVRKETIREEDNFGGGVRCMFDLPRRTRIEQLLPLADRQDQSRSKRRMQSRIE